MLVRFILLKVAFCIVFFLYGSFSLPAQTVEDEVSRLIDAIIENRLRVTRWQATVRATYEGQQGEERQVVGADTYVDGVRMRKDVHRLYDKGVQRPDPDRFTYRDVESYTDNHYYQYSSRGKVGGRGTALVVRNKSELKRLQTQEELISYDPRAIGNSSTPALSTAFSVPGTLRQPGRRSVTMDDDVLSDGTECKRVTATYPLGVLTYWVSIGEGPSVRRYHARGTDAGDGTQLDGFWEQTETVVAEWKDSGIWLPKSTHYERYEHHQLVMTEDAEIEFQSVNEPLDTDLFEPSRFGITPGQNVYYQPSRDYRSYVWDGEKVAEVKQDYDNPATELLQNGRSGFFSVTTVLLMNACFFVVLSFYFLARMLRSKAGRALQKPGNDC